MVTEELLRQIKPQLHYQTGAIEAAVFAKKSLEPLSSITDAMKRKEAEKQVLSNYFNVPVGRIIMLDQVHGFDCVRISNIDLPTTPLVYAKADASLTLEKNVLLVIRTADCLPVFFHSEVQRPAVEGEEASNSPTGHLVGILHAGWRGLANGIIANVSALATHVVEHSIRSKIDVAEPLHFFAGPCIPVSQYEVGSDVWQRFPFYDTRPNDKANLDLLKNARWLLQESFKRKKYVFDDPFGLTTGANEAFYAESFSHRRGETGRNLNVIRINESSNGR